MTMAIAPVPPLVLGVMFTGTSAKGEEGGFGPLRGVVAGEVGSHTPAHHRGRFGGVHPERHMDHPMVQAGVVPGEGEPG